MDSTTSSYSLVSTRQSAESALRDTADFDAYLQRRMDAALAKYAPDLKNVLSSGGVDLHAYMSKVLPTLVAGEVDTYKQLRKVGSTYMTGQVPADAVAQMRQSTAQGALSHGVRGQSAVNLQARELGKTSEAYQLEGAKFLAGATATSENLSKLHSGIVDQMGSYATTAQNMMSAGQTPVNTLSALTQLSLSTEQNNAATINDDKWSTYNAKWAALVPQFESAAGIRSLQAANPGTDYSSLAANVSKFNQSLADATMNILGGGGVSQLPV